MEYNFFFLFWIVVCILLNLFWRYAHARAICFLLSSTHGTPWLVRLSCQLVCLLILRAWHVSMQHNIFSWLYHGIQPVPFHNQHKSNTFYFEPYLRSQYSQRWTCRSPSSSFSTVHIALPTPYSSDASLVSWTVKKNEEKNWLFNTLITYPVINFNDISIWMSKSSTQWCVSNSHLILRVVCTFRFQNTWIAKLASNRVLIMIAIIDFTGKSGFVSHFLACVAA